MNNTQTDCTAMPAEMPNEFHAFDDPIQDRLLGIVLALGAEVWVLRDRFKLLEDALGEHDIDVHRRIDELCQGDTHVQEMEVDREAFMSRLFQSVRTAAREPLSRIRPREEQ